MAKKRAEPRRMSTPTPFEQARDELFSHILRCGVLEATAEHQKEWFDDTMLYLADLGTAQNVHPHPFRAGPRRAVLPYPPMRRPGSQRRAPERVVRRHHALSRRPLRRVGRAAAHRAARSGGALLPPRGGAQRDGGRERLTSRLTTTAETAGSAGPATAAPRRPSPAPRTIPGGAPALPPL